MGTEHQRIARPAKAAAVSAKAAAVPAKAGAKTAALGDVGWMSSVPAAVSPDFVLMLQRTVGNAAINQLLGSPPRSPRMNVSAARVGRAVALPQSISVEQAAPAGSGSRLPMVQRKLMSFVEFAQVTHQVSETKGRFGGKKRETNEERADTLRGVKGMEALSKERESRGLGADLEADMSDQVNINQAYKAYEADPSLGTLTALYDTITFWETINTGRPWVTALTVVLEKVKRDIEAEVRAATKTQAGTLDDMLSRLIQGKNAATVLTTRMPKFLTEVGVPAAFYKEHLEGKPDLIDALEEFYNKLRDGHQYHAERAFRKVSHLEGMYLIRPLFLGHFPQNAHLEGLVGTEEKGAEGQELTPEEVEAIKTYSGEHYKDMNSQMRSHVMRPETKSVLGETRPQSNKAAKQADRDRRTTMKDATSGLSKLPKFQGIAYRMLIKVPKGYHDIMQKGAMVADLGFQSASPSMTGVGNFVKTQLDEGTRSTYFIIHTRTAANIVGLSKSPGEGEVLFRPGTRFQVMAVWEHVYGMVPPDAPPQAQMILHAQGELKSKRGKTPEEWKLDNEASKEYWKKQGNAEKLAKAEADMFETGAGKVKVIELIEV